jgi:hypothetical protein
MAHPFASEDVSRPVAIIEKDRATTHTVPCHYRCRGLVVINNTPLMEGPLWAARRENGWQTDEAWGVTHEASGANVCLWETRAEAVAALQVLLALSGVDWTRDMETVRRRVMASEIARVTVAALKQGRMVVVPVVRGFPMKRGSA